MNRFDDDEHLVEAVESADAVEVILRAATIAAPAFERFGWATNRYSSIEAQIERSLWECRKHLIEHPGSSLMWGGRLVAYQTRIRLGFGLDLGSIELT
jgi:hypothetical protein